MNRSAAVCVLTMGIYAAYRFIDHKFKSHTTTATQHSQKLETKRIVRETLLVGLIVFVSEKTYEAYTRGQMNTILQSFKGGGGNRHSPNEIDHDLLLVTPGELTD